MKLYICLVMKIVYRVSIVKKSIRMDGIFFFKIFFGNCTINFQKM